MNTSYYILTFSDGNTIHSDDVSWHKYAQKRTVQRQGKTYIVYASVVPIKSIKVYHNGLEKDLEIPENCEVYQATNARTLIVGEKTTTEILGRVLGLVKNGVIIEEYQLSQETGMITGFKI